MKKDSNKIVILNLIQDIQRLSLFLNNLRGRFRNKFGMTLCQNNAGFTLVEVLVVVLIIGILAAVAVPQYNKAVAKTRATEALMMLQNISKAEEVYYLTNQEYTNNLNALDISVPTDQIGANWWESDATRPNTYIYSCGSSKTTCVAVASNRAQIPVIQVFFPATATPGLYCTSNAKDNLAAQICKEMSIDKEDTNSGTGATYRLQ